MPVRQTVAYPISLLRGWTRRSAHSHRRGARLQQLEAVVAGGRYSHTATAPSDTFIRPELRSLQQEAEWFLWMIERGKGWPMDRIRRGLPRVAGFSDAEITKAEVTLAESQQVVAADYGYLDWSTRWRDSTTSPTSKITKSSSSSLVSAVTGWPSPSRLAATDCSNASGRTCQPQRGKRWSIRWKSWAPANECGGSGAGTDAGAILQQRPVGVSVAHTVRRYRHPVRRRRGLHPRRLSVRS